MDDEDLRILLMCCRPRGAWGKSILLELEPTLATSAVVSFDRAHLNRIYAVLGDLVAQKLCQWQYEPPIVKGSTRKVHYATTEGKERARQRVAALNELYKAAIERSSHENR